VEVGRGGGPGCWRQYWLRTLRRLAHAGNDGAYVGIVEDEAQRHLGQGVVRERGKRAAKRFGAGDTAFQIFRDKVSVAQSPFGQVLSTVSVPVSVPSSNGTRAMTATSFMRQMGKSASSGFWSKML